MARSTVELGCNCPAFTITNLGMYEIDAFTPIINLPEAAIMGVGRIKPRPAVVDGEVHIRQTMGLHCIFVIAPQKLDLARI